MGVYDHMVAYLHSQTLRWSYASFRGRYWDAWEKHVASLEPEAMLESLALSRFSAVYFDRAGYSAGNTVEQRVAAILRTTPLVREDGRIAIYSLGTYAQVLRSRWTPGELAIRERSLYPILVRWGAGFSGEEKNGTNVWRWCSRTSELVVENGSSAPERLTIEGHAATGYPEASDLRVEGPGRSVTFTVTSSGRSFAAAFDIPAGIHRIRFSSTARRVPAPKDPRTLVFQLRGVRISAAAGAQDGTVLFAN